MKNYLKMHITKISAIICCLLYININAQSKENSASEDYDFLYDSLSAKKSELLSERDFLNNNIDSLKNFISALEEKIKTCKDDRILKKYGNEIGNRILQGQIWKGMTEKMLADSWGKPDKVNTNKEKWGIFTQWFYGDITYFFRDGIMIDWEENK